MRACMRSCVRACTAISLPRCAASSKGKNAPLNSAVPCAKCIEVYTDMCIEMCTDICAKPYTWTQAHKDTKRTHARKCMTHTAPCRPSTKQIYKHTDTQAHEFTHTCAHARAHAHTHAFMHRPHARTRTHMHAFMHVRTHARTHARTQACRHTRSFAYLTYHLAQPRIDVAAPDFVITLLLVHEHMPHLPRRTTTCVSVCVCVRVQAIEGGIRMQESTRVVPLPSCASRKLCGSPMLGMSTRNTSVYL